ncbi:MAG: AAA family ATPase [Alphaproteobacteria bacterium]|nr:AAA family ATPase [Alphaproteobacteria bacterium]
MTDPLILREVKLRYFKAAFKPDPVALDAFNVVIGRNGSGKSTMLEALQWLDTSLRRDAREASERYYGVRDLLNLRSQSKKPHFVLSLKFGAETGLPEWSYRLQVEERDGLPVVTEEELETLNSSGNRTRRFITMGDGTVRLLGVNPKAGDPGVFSSREPDRLALSKVGDIDAPDHTDGLGALQAFWERAVFLRLSPNRLAAGSPAKRRSFEPILDEEGQTLPALLNELNDDQREELVDAIRTILPGFHGVSVSRSASGRDTRVNYSLLEQMPHRGRSGRKRFPIPAWMLSEGTRRITAILALLVREPAPTLLCIEEIENGLDPWTVRHVLRHLRSAADRGVQVVLTTHSPWLLDDVPMESIIQVRRVDGDTRYERFIDRPEIQAYAPNVPAGTRYVNEIQ